jgi:two-component system response regulator AlgR
MSKPAVTAQPTQYLSASQQGRLIRVAVADIWFLRAEQKYVTAYYSAGSLLLSTSLKELEKQLANYFIRIHRNTLVATGCIKRLAKDTRGHWRLYLRGLTESLPVSRRQVAAVRRYLRADHVS